MIFKQAVYTIAIKQVSNIIRYNAGYCDNRSKSTVISKNVIYCNDIIDLLFNNKFGDPDRTIGKSQSIIINKILNLHPFSRVLVKA